MMKVESFGLDNFCINAINHSSGNCAMIDLQGSKNLTKTPDLTGIPNLEELELSFCTGLVEVHPSIAVHKKLKILSLTRCENIKSFPKEIEMDSLMHFNLNGCSKLKIPEFSRAMKNLSHLRVRGIANEKIPSSIECLVGLVSLHFYDCKSLTCIPSAIIKSLTSLYVIRCLKFEKLIENEGEMEYCLEELIINETAIRELSFLLNMKKLKKLRFRGSEKMFLLTISFNNLATSFHRHNLHSP